jgi:hypothetical protein
MGAPLAAFTATVRPEIGVVVLVGGELPHLPLDAWARAAARFVIVSASTDDVPAGDDAAAETDTRSAPPTHVGEIDAGIDALRTAGLAVDVLAVADTGAIAELLVAHLLP